MNPISKPAHLDDDRTAEEQAPDSDRQALSLDYTGQFAPGMVDHDDRGQARWKWHSEIAPAASTDGSFDLLKALDNDALSIESEPKEEVQAPQPDTGNNPYDVGGATAVTPRRKHP